MKSKKNREKKVTMSLIAALGLCANVAGAQDIQTYSPKSIVTLQSQGSEYYYKADDLKSAINILAGKFDRLDQSQLNGGSRFLKELHSLRLGNPEDVVIMGSDAESMHLIEKALKGSFTNDAKGALAAVIFYVNP